jgi:hypothetical protein
MKQKNTVEIASDRRARVPFAIIGVLLLTISGTVVYTLQGRSDRKDTVQPGDDIAEVERQLEVAIQSAARQSLEKAGEMPVTKVSSNPAGRALEGESDAEIFSRYSKLRFYLNLERKIADIERVHSNRVDGDNLKIKIRFPQAKYTEESLNNAIDRVSIERTDKPDDPPVEKISITAGKVPIIVYHNGREIARKNVEIKTTTESAVFDMHDRTEEFERKLGHVGAALHGPMYGVAYAKAALERAMGDPDPVNARFFTDIVTLLEMKQFTNYIIFAMQQTTFGTTAKSSDNAAVGGGCLGYYYFARVIGQGFLNEFVPPPSILCPITKRSFTSQGQFSDVSSLKGNLNQLAEQKKAGVDAKNASVSGTGSTDSAVSNALNQKQYLNRSDIAKMAYRNVTGQNSSISEMTDGKVKSLPKNQRNTGMSGSMWHVGEFEGQINSTIKDIYTVGSTVRDTEQTGDALNSSVDYRVQKVGAVSVTETNIDDRTGIERTVLIELPVTLVKTENSTDTKSVTFKSTVSVGATASTGATVEERGISQPYNDFIFRWGRPEYLPSFADAENKSVGVISSQYLSTDRIEKRLENNIQTDNITSKEEFGSAIETNISARGTVSHTEITTKREREELRKFLSDDLTSLHRRVMANDVSVKLKPKEVILKKDVFSKLLISEETSQQYIYHRVENRYPKVPDKARSELRKRYIDTINWYVREAERNRKKARERIKNSTPDDTTLEEAVQKPEPTNFTRNETHQQSDGDAIYELSVAPDWFTQRPKTSNKIPEIKPADEVRQDVEPFKHRSLSMRKLAPIPHPGIPITPFPPAWFLSVNYWHLDVRGEYASFKLKPSATELAEADTTYVRQPQPVPLEINGLRRTVGRVEPIGFSATNYIFVAMPGLVPMPTGSLGVGDRIDTTDWFTTCTESWPRPGPGHENPVPYGFQGGTCPTTGPWGEILFQGAHFFGLKVFRNMLKAGMKTRLKSKIRWHNSVVHRADPTNGYVSMDQKMVRMSEAVGEPTWNIPKLDSLLLSGGSGYTKKVKEAVKVFRDLGIHVSAEKIADIMFDTILGMQAYQKNVLCPLGQQEKQQLGCDDDQLEVDVFDGGSQDGDIVVIRSKRSFKGTDRTLVVDTRSGTLSKSEVPKHIRDGLKKGPTAGTVKVVDDNFTPPVNYYLKNTRNGYSLRNENNSITNIGSLEEESTMVEATIEILEPTPDGGTEPPLVYISYAQYGILVAPGDNSVDWEHVGEQLNDASKPVDVLITSQSGHDALADDFSAKTSVLIDVDGNGNVECDGLDSAEVYIPDDSEKVSFRVSEEDWLFGPDTAPETHC